MTAAAPPSPLVPHRAVITPLLHGEGLEIGALHFPFVVPAPHTVTYLDVEPVDTIRERFPELAEHPLVTPTQLGDVGMRPVSEITEHCHSEAFQSHEAFTAALAAVRGRREHAHVWDSTSFRSFLERTVALLGLRTAWLHESTGATNRFEYFGVLARTDGAEPRAVALTVLDAVYRTRSDLQAAYPDGPRRLPRLLAWARDAGSTVDRDAPVLGPHADAFRALAATTRRAS